MRSQFWDWTLSHERQGRARLSTAGEAGTKTERVTSRHAAGCKFRPRTTRLTRGWEPKLLRPGTGRAPESLRVLRRSWQNVIERAAADPASRRFSKDCDRHTSQICTPCFSEARTSGRAGMNSWATWPLKPVSTMAFITVE